MVLVQHKCETMIWAKNTEFLMLQKECTLHQTRTMTATSTTIPPALKDMPAPLGDTPKK